MFEIVYRYDPDHPATARQPADAHEARRRLIEGNRGFAHLLQHTGDKHQPTRRIIRFDPRDLGLSEAGGAGAPRQQPFAVVLGCSDARVPIELIFNQWCNELFVVRVAGHVLGPGALGSIDFAVTNLGASVKLLVVLAHSGCGAVTAAVDVFLDPAAYLDLANSHSLRTIINRIVVLARGAARALEVAWGGDVIRRPGYRRALIEATVVINAAYGAYTLAQDLRRGSNTNGIGAVYGVYDLSSRCVHAPGCHDHPATDIWLADAPTSSEDFLALARRLAASERIMELLEAPSS